MRQNTEIVPTTVPWSSALLETVLTNLQKKYAFLRIEAIGRSVLGRLLYQVSIGRGPCRVGFNAAHHANEWITTPVLLRFLEEYCAGLLRGEKLGGVDCIRLFDDHTLDMVPMVNPDGGVGLRRGSL